MADQSSENPDNQKRVISVEDEEKGLLDGFDAFLAEADPEFSKEINEIGNDKNLSIAQIILSDVDQELAAEKEKWENGNFIKQKLVKNLPFIPSLSIKIGKIKFVLKMKLRSFWVRFKNRAYAFASSFIKSISLFFKSFFSWFAKKIKAFQYLSFSKKMLLIGSFLLFFAIGALLYLSFTSGVIPKGQGLFLSNLEMVADQVYSYEPGRDEEPFYDNLRTSSNLFLINKMVVNILRSENSSENPMAAFEFMVEGVAPDVIIEVKDREIEMRDLMQRTIEGMNFDLLSSPEGKNYMCEELKNQLNRRLTTGKIKRIFLKTAIIKP